MKNALWTGVAGLALIAGAASAQDLVFTPGEGPFDWAGFEEYKANAPDLSGQSLTIFGPWLSPEAEYFSNILAYFEDATGVNATYTGSDGFEQQIVIDAEAGSPPNIAIFPQPGLAATMAAQGLLTPLPEDMAAWVADNYAAGQSWVDLGTFADETGADQLFGYFYNVNVKSLVWYNPENFEDAGYEVPETMEELIALSEQMIADGETPWCIGLASGPATGWPATDWVEDIMLRTQAPEVYDQWVTNEIPFNDDRVKEAIETFGMFARNDDMVAGGAGGVASTDFRDSPTGLFSSPPQCYMHRQASFATAFFPEDVTVGEDADFFYFPAFAGKDLGSPVLGAGTLMTITDPSDATAEFMNFLKQPIAHELFMAQSGFLTPHTGVNIDAYRDETLRKQGQILLDATTFRFDASDLMPGAVGAGTFWTGMVDYVGGADVDEVTDAIQSSWDALK
jgi:alpha-glucoside transport system substrate-binding protein